MFKNLTKKELAWVLYTLRNQNASADFIKIEEYKTAGVFLPPHAFCHFVRSIFCPSLGALVQPFSVSM